MGRRQRLGALMLLALLPCAPSLAFEPGLDLRVYPTGGIVGVQASLAADAQRDWGWSAAYNIARRDDAGEHQDERGGGPGLGLYANRHFDNGPWFVGARAELFLLSIDWRDPGTRGNSDVTMLQPTLVGGYRYRLSSGLVLRFSLQGGAEINLDTRGEDVGEGAIGLVGVAIGY